MLVLLSPAKTLDFEPWTAGACTKPLLLRESKQLVDELRKYSKTQLAKLMNLSDKLADLNYQRFRDFRLPFNKSNAKPALLAFTGDVYKGIEAKKYKKSDFNFAQKHLRILSGLYGVLRPLDLIQPYRLEMGTKLKNPHGSNLYEFWGDKITEVLARDIIQKRYDTVVNLASQEYYKSIQPEDLDARIITPQFKEKKGSSYRTVALFAKQARGLMANYIVERRIKDPKELVKFRSEGYRYHKSLSSDNDLVFVRE